MVEIGTRSRIPHWLTFVFSNQKSLCQPKIGIMLTIDVDEIWFVDRFWPSEGEYIDKYDTGSSIERPRPPS